MAMLEQKLHDLHYNTETLTERSLISFSSYGYPLYIYFDYVLTNDQNYNPNLWSLFAIN